MEFAATCCTFLVELHFGEYTQDQPLYDSQRSDSKNDRKNNFYSTKSEFHQPSGFMFLSEGSSSIQSWLAWCLINQQVNGEA